MFNSGSCDGRIQLIQDGAQQAQPKACRYRGMGQRGMPGGERLKGDLIERTDAVKGPRSQPDIITGDLTARQRIGYVRVSTFEQNAQRQLDEIPVDRLFIDQASGKDTKRPQLETMLAFVREGDTVVVHSMDRLARNLDDLRRLVQQLTCRAIRIEFVKEGLTFTREDSPMAHLMLSVMGAFAEFERSLLRDRQREGIALARQRGAYRGRKRSLTADQITDLKRRIAAGEGKAHVARASPRAITAATPGPGAVDLPSVCSESTAFCTPRIASITGSSHPLAATDREPYATSGANR
jgi:DNA invertase Pin-like site-specific DNA recombinase